MPTREAPLAKVLAGLAAAVFVAAVPLVVVDVAGPYGTKTGEFVIAAFAPGFVVAGLVVARRRPELPVGWLYLVGGLLAALAGCGAAYTGAALAQGWSGARWGIWVTSWTWFAQETCAAVALLLFPDGRPLSAKSRQLIGLLLGAAAVAMLLTMVVPGGITTTPGTSDVVKRMHNPLGISVVPGLRVARDVLEILSGVAASVTAAVVIVTRFFRARGVRRTQLRWLVPIVVLSILPIPPLQVVVTIMGIVVVTNAIVRHRALNINVALRRSVLAGALLATALGTYAAVVAVVGAAVGTTGPVISAVGATVAVFAFAPLSLHIRKAVDRLFYGRRAEPYQVVAALGQRLSDAVSPDEGLRALAASLSEQLRLPFVEVSGESGQVLAVRGEPELADEPVTIPLDHQGQRVGILRVGHRRGEPTLTPTETELLENLAHQAGAAVQAVALVGDLRRARERLVLAREDKRRRLQRDLHDGLGPKLTAVAYKVDAARNRIPAEPDTAATLLQASGREIRDAVSDIRRLVNDLGDPSLDTLGLIATLRDQASRFPSSHTGVTIDVTADGVDDLPAAVEVAAYRIATEAMNNTVRHAEATKCLVAITVDRDLRLTVTDNGRGLDAVWKPGVGIRSMTERAVELGGTCTISNGAAGGTIVDVRIPLHRADSP